MRWLLARLISDDDRRAIEADLAELYEMRRREIGDAAAAKWMRAQRRQAIWHVIREQFGSVNPRSTMPYIGRDIRYSLRSLVRVPTLALTIILTVGVGLGATAAMATVVRAVIINPLPYADANKLFWIYTDAKPFRFRFSVVDYRALERDHPTFSGIAAYLWK